MPVWAEAGDVAWSRVQISPEWILSHISRPQQVHRLVGARKEVKVAEKMPDET